MNKRFAVWDEHGNVVGIFNENFERHARDLSIELGGFTATIWVDGNHDPVQNLAPDIVSQHGNPLGANLDLVDL